MGAGGTDLLEEVLHDPLLRDVGADGEPVLELALHLPHLLLVPLRRKPLSTCTHTHAHHVTSSDTQSVEWRLCTDRRGSRRALRPWWTPGTAARPRPRGSPEQTEAETSLPETLRSGRWPPVACKGVCGSICKAVESLATCRPLRCGRSLNSDLTVMGMELLLPVSLSCCLAPPLITT